MYTSAQSSSPLVAQRFPAYAPVGALQFIDWEDKLQTDSRDLAIERNLHTHKSQLKVTRGHLAHTRSCFGWTTGN